MIDPANRHSAGVAVCLALRNEASRCGIDLGDTPAWPAAEFREEVDAYSGEVGLLGIWRDGARYGEVRFLADGRVFAEYQVMAPLPGKPGLFVESVSVWGHPGALKGDPVIVEWDPT
ncbi:MAG: hypothetical protein EG825_10725 [Rhodocyclaceae bacterium]|nr:hypothetical protein [Rhodocyclaceae bacterium]